MERLVELSLIVIAVSALAFACGYFVALLVASAAELFEEFKQVRKAPRKVKEEKESEVDTSNEDSKVKEVNGSTDVNSVALLDKPKKKKGKKRAEVENKES
jgi:hypothetical protein